MRWHGGDILDTLTEILLEWDADCRVDPYPEESYILGLGDRALEEIRELVDGKLEEERGYSIYDCEFERESSEQRGKVIHPNE